jgi:fermentation-respiration switch protein FrsA (DUF1100 family)
MRRRGPIPVIGVLLLLVLGLAACGGGKQQSAAPVVETLTYKPGVALHASATDGGVTGDVHAEQVSYTSVDGQTVPALFTTPASRKPQGCLVYQGGFAQTKEQAPGLRSGAAALGLATFTIDPRNVGGRGSLDQAIAAIKQPEALRAMILDTVADVRVGLDYLESRPECHHNLAFMGTSFGAIVGSITAGQDSRVKATILTSIGPSFQRGLIKTNAEAAKDPKFPLAMVPGAATDPKILARTLSILSPLDPARWVGKIAPRPVLLINGLSDPLVSHDDARNIAAAAREPKSILNADTGHDPFAPGPGLEAITVRVAAFLTHNLDLTKP